MDAILHLQALPGKSAALARNGRQFMHTEFSREVVLEEFSRRLSALHQPLAEVDALAEKAVAESRTGSV
jgi:hypothetical protein